MTPGFLTANRYKRLSRTHDSDFFVVDRSWSILSCSNVPSSYQVYCMMSSHYTLDSDAACSTQCQVIQTKQSRPPTIVRMWPKTGNKLSHPLLNPVFLCRELVSSLQLVAILVGVSKQGHRKDCVWSGAVIFCFRRGDLASQRHCQRATLLGTLV